MGKGPKNNTHTPLRGFKTFLVQIKKCVSKDVTNKDMTFFKTILQKCINIPNHISILGSLGGGARGSFAPPKSVRGATAYSPPPEDAPEPSLRKNCQKHLHFQFSDAERTYST